MKKIKNMKMHRIIGELDELRGKVFEIATMGSEDARIAKAQVISDRLNRIYDSLTIPIPLFKCKDGWLYRVNGRNCCYGIFVKELKGFVYLREKFGSERLDTEYHYDVGEPLGSCIALLAIERFGKFPHDYCSCLTMDSTLRTRRFHKKVFDYLKKGGW